MSRTIRYIREAVPCRAASRPLWSRYLHERRQERASATEAHALAARVEVAAGALLGTPTSSCAGVPGVTRPRVVSVVLGPTRKVLLRMPPGQTVEDFIEVRDRLAAAIWVHDVRVVHRGGPFVRLDLVDVDPLAAPVQLPVAVSTVEDPITLGGTEAAGLLRASLVDLGHMIVQGQTRSGKSRFLYGLLSQLAWCPDLRISGSDVTGILLRPFAESRHASGQVLGSRDPHGHAELLERLVSEMDDRIARMPKRSDVLPVSIEDPIELVIIEELPGLLRLAANVDAAQGKKHGGARDRITAAYGRLMAEGAKVGYRVVLISQRAEASIIDGFARGQAVTRLSFRVDSRVALEMLHPTVPSGLALSHLTAPAGFALVSAPSIPCSRIRAPEMGAYGEFLDNIEAAADAACPPPLLAPVAA